MSFIDDLNTGLEDIQEELDDLYGRSKKQILSLLDKSNSSFTELSNVFRRDSPLEDSFVDSSKVQATQDLVLDKNGWTNAFTIEETRFLDDYYTRATFPMTMPGGRVIPGSRFMDIFQDREGFWGYMRDDEQPTDVDFTLTFKVTAQTPLAKVNKLYLRTNNTLEVEAFYRTSFSGTWVSMGKRRGQHHIWSVPFSGVEVNFRAHTSVFSVSLVQAGMATFELTGSLTSTYYEVDNLRNLEIQKEGEIPMGTAIRTFVHITDTPLGTPPLSGFTSWENETQVTLSAAETVGPSYSGYVIPSGYLESSLVVRSGFQKWDLISTTDYMIVTESVDRLTDTTLDIPAGYKIITGGVRTIYTGEGEARTEYDLGEDFTVAYDLDANSVRVYYSPNGRLPTSPETIPKAEVLLRRPTAVLQRRTFVDLEIDRDIVISVPTAGVTLRTLHIGDTIENETTIQDLPVGTYTITGKTGLNLIEVEGFDANNPPQLVGPYKHFATRYRQQRSETDPPGSNEFYLQPASGGHKIVSSAADLYVRYLQPTGFNQVCVRFEFEGKEDAAPVLGAYRLANRIDRS